MVDPRLLAVAACPACHSALTAEEEALHCTGCGTVFGAEGGLPDLCPPGYDASGRWAGDTEAQARLRRRADTARLLQDPSVQYAIREAIARLPVGGRLLDAGAGTGTIAATLARLAPAGCTVYVNDLSWPMLAMAWENLAGQENVVLFRAEAHQPPYADGVFDVILARLTPFGFPNALRALKPGGTYLSVDYGTAQWRELDDVFPPERRERHGVPSTDDERRLYGREVGFAMVETHGWLWEEVRPLEAVRDALDFAPIIEAFDRERDAAYLEELKRRFGTEGGIRLTYAPRVTLARKGI